MALARPVELNHLFQDVAIVNPQLGEVLVRGATHWTNGAAAAGMTGGPINAKDKGALGVGGGNAPEQFITQEDIDAHPEWFDGAVCRYQVGYPYYLSDTWDFVGIQEAIYAAYGGPGAKHGLANADLNREVFIPAGDYRVNRALQLNNAIGVILSGAGRFSTSIYIAQPDQPVLETNMSYSVIRGIYFGYGAGTPCTVPTALVEWVWGAETPAAGLAQLSVYDCIYHGGGYANVIGFRVARDLIQGDNVIHHNCFFASCYYAAFATGSGAFNALNMAFVACNWQNCYQQGILVYGGNVILHDCSFQNGALGAATPQTGFDITLLSNAANSCSIINGCRSESQRFLHADSYHNIDMRGCANVVSPAPWAALTAYGVGDIRGAVAHEDGRPYICVTAGTSGATEPVWDGTTGIADGSVVWDVYNYNILEFDHGTIENCSLPWGRVTIGSVTPVRIVNNIFSRDDWLYQATAPAETRLGLPTHNNLLCGNQVVHGGGISQGEMVPYSLPTYGAEPDHLEAYSHYYLPPTTPLLWTRNGHRSGTAHRCARDVGFWPPKGHYADGTNEDLSTNVAGILNALGPRHAAETANLAGTDLLLQGGLGRGTGASGLIRLRTAAPGTAGSDLNLPGTLDALAISHARVMAGVYVTLRHVTQPQEDALTGMRPGDQVWSVTRSRTRVWNGFTWEDASAGTITWDPTEFGADLQAWWTVDDPATLFQNSALSTPAVADTDPIGGIADKSGNSRPLLQATAGARPQLKLALAAGRPVARFDGVDNFLQTANFDRYTTPNTLVIVFRCTNTGYIISPANGLAGELIQIGAGVQFGFGDGGANRQVNGDAATQFGTIIATYAGTASEVWLNGTVGFGATLAAGGLPQGITIGGRYNGSEFGAVDFCEAFVVGRPLTDTERDQVGLYANRWGTPEPVLNS